MFGESDQGQKRSRARTGLPQKSWRETVMEKLTYTPEQRDAPCQTPATTSAATQVVRHAASSALRHQPDTPSQHAPYGPVPRIAIGPRLAGAQNIDLTAQAVTQCNRERQAVQRYLATHQALARAIYSEGDA